MPHGRVLARVLNPTKNLRVTQHSFAEWIVIGRIFLIEHRRRGQRRSMLLCRPRAELILNYRQQVNALIKHLPEAIRIEKHQSGKLTTGRTPMKKRSKQSAGLLMFRKNGNSVEVFLVHPGGPFWAKRNERAWTLPKGEFESDEKALSAAQREFHEETGFAALGPYLDIGSDRCGWCGVQVNRSCLYPPRPGAPSDQSTRLLSGC